MCHVTGRCRLIGTASARQLPSRVVRASVERLLSYRLLRGRQLSDIAPISPTIWRNSELYWGVVLGFCKARPGPFERVQLGMAARPDLRVLRAGRMSLVRMIRSKLVPAISCMLTQVPKIAHQTGTLLRDLIAGVGKIVRAAASGEGHC